MAIKDIVLEGTTPSYMVTRGLGNFSGGGGGGGGTPRPASVRRLLLFARQRLRVI